MSCSQSPNQRLSPKYWENCSALRVALIRINFTSGLAGVATLIGAHTYLLSPSHPLPLPPSLFLLPHPLPPAHLTARRSRRMMRTKSVWMFRSWTSSKMMWEARNSELAPVAGERCSYISTIPHPHQYTDPPTLLKGPTPHRSVVIQRSRTPVVT